MNNDFDFKKAGKRMPYIVPDDFFAEMEDNVWQELRRQPAVRTKKDRAFIRIVITALTTTAAAIVLALALNQGHSVGYADVEQAFGNLSTEDQMYMISIYQDDIFINE